jgi:xanthine dehydrogenase accessory factor
MSETAEVLEAISSFDAEGRKIALATIVGVTGSTYRRPGARLLVAEDGKMVGNLSGGCLEGEVHGVAQIVMESGESRLELYDLTADDEVVWGWGLGCNGAIEVFIEPADKAVELAGAIRRAIDEERPVVAATVLESSAPGVEPGARLLVEANGSFDGTLGRDADDQAIAAESLRSLAAGETVAREVALSEGTARIFFESIEPPPRLMICGAGHDSIPVAAVAAGLGWRVVVVDDRESLLNSERFPGAQTFVNCPPAEVAAAANVDERTYVVVMSHNYLRDKDYLRALYGSRAAYVGMLGPKARLERLLSDLATEGVTPTDEELARIHGPAGLDIGAEGPEEIAAAIVAEIMALARGRRAGFLRDRNEPIHPRRQQPAVAT